MIEKGKIGVRQFTVLIILFTIGSSILIIPSGLAQGAKQDAWISAVVGLIGGLLLVMLYNMITIRFPNTTLVHYSQEVLGKWLGRCVSFLYFVYFFLLASFVLRNIGDFLTTEVLPNTPIHIIHIFFLLVIILGARNGIEVFTRSAEIFFPWLIIFFLLLAFLLTPNYQIGHILPVFGYGIKPVLRGAITILGTPYLELAVFLMVFPFVNHSPKARRAFLIGVFIAGIMLVIISLLTILVLGADLTANQLYPSYNLAEKISIGEFLERLEIIMAGIWFITIYFKLAICFYAATMTFAELFKLKEARQLYLPFGMIMIVSSIVMFPNTSYFLNFISIYFFYAMPFAIIFPLLILIVAMIRKKKAS